MASSSLIVELSRRVTRTLDLGKGMFFDPDAMAVLVECGAVELIQKGAVDNLKERAAERLKAREARSYSTAPEFVAEEHERPAAHRNRAPGQKPFGGALARKSRPIRAEPDATRREDVDEAFDRARRAVEPRSCSTEGKEALARCKRALESPSKRRMDNVTVLRPRQRG